MSVAAAICAGMPERWYRAAMYKWGLDSSQRQWLFIELWMATMEMARREGWNTAGKQVCRCGNALSMKLPEMDPAEEIEFEQMLFRTQDTGYAYIVADLAMREVGDSRFWTLPHHWPKKAVALGSAKSAWFSTWDDRVAASRQIFEDWAGRGYAYAARRQRGGEGEAA